MKNQQYTEAKEDDVNCIKNLKLAKYPKPVMDLISQIYGTQKEFDRIINIRFKPSEESYNQLMELVDAMIVNSVLAGVQYQKEYDRMELRRLNKHVETLEKKMKTMKRF